MTIRSAEISEEDPIRLLHLAAFDATENELVAELAVGLLIESSRPEALHLVADSGGGLVGHIAFSPVTSKADGNLLGYILSPLAVDPDCQKTGIGSRLVQEGLRLLADRCVRLVFVYGSPDYYGRFGFTAGLAEGFAPPFRLQYPFGWQAVDLDPRKPPVRPESIECVRALRKPELW